MVKIILTLLILIENTYAGVYKSLYDEFLKPGAKSKGYSYALTASEMGLVSIFYNPANITFNNNRIGFYFSKENYYLINDISHLTAGISFKLYNEPTIYSAFSWRKFDFFDVVAYDDNENILMWTIGLKREYISIGINCKYFFSHLNSPEIQSDSDGYGFDVGFSFKFNRFLIGVSSFNLFAQMKYNDNYIEKLTPYYNLGINYNISKNLSLYLNGNRLFEENNINFAVGCKLTKSFSFSIGTSTKKIIGSGIYLTINKFSLNYGFLYSINESTDKSSISFSFDL